MWKARHKRAWRQATERRSVGEEREGRKVRARPYRRTRRKEKSRDLAVEVMQTD